MRGGIARFGSIAVALNLALGHAAVAAECSDLRLLASVPITTHPNGIISVPATIKDREKQLLVDTGAIISVLSAETVADAGLRPKLLPDIEFVMFGGNKLREYVIAPLKLGNLTGDKVYFMVMPGNLGGGGLAGLLGPDLLHQYDIELDFARGKFNIFMPNECEQAPVYWTQQPFAAVPMRRASDRYFKTIVTVRLDGKRLEAELDTGSTSSFLSLQTARRLFGWSDKSKMPEMTETEGGGYRYPFKSLEFEGIEVRNPDITLYSESTMKWGAMTKLVLGMSVLRQAHLYIAYKDQIVYITPASAN